MAFEIKHPGEKEVLSVMQRSYNEGDELCLRFLNGQWYVAEFDPTEDKPKTQSMSRKVKSELAGVNSKVKDLEEEFNEFKKLVSERYIDLIKFIRH